ncbi:hypothetical protein HD806DRAFT_423915 [Xylariaceae sp. AK1471]|nr:hypothetical protein HD806DRAFT_423915 [Xylariaceae sp. AK1471]
MDLMDLDPTTEAALYKPLGESEFRLLILQPAPPTAPLVVNLVSVSITDPPEYDGISYVWGDLHDVVSITCDGISTNITTSLHWALVRVRLLDRPRVVWADALCINQNDTQERNRQVTLMGHIYAKARFVLACMGQDAQDAAHQVASLVNQYEPILVRIGDSDVYREFDSPDMRRFWGHVVGADGHVERWRHLGDLLQRSWFRRAWVLQEVGLAKDPRVVYGSVEFSYRAMITLVHGITRYAGGFATSTGVGALLIHTQWANWTGRALNPSHRIYKFVDLLDHGALLECRDPRDRVYAFLGHPLANDQIVPDYTKNIMQVYQEATVLLLRDTGTRALSSVEHSNTTIHDNYPSWVIRWNIGFILNNIYTHPNYFYRAGLTAQPGLAQIDGDRLRIEGVMFDTVRSVHIVQTIESTKQIRFASFDGIGVWSFLDLIRYLEDASTPCAYQNLRLLNLASALTCQVALDDSLLTTVFADEWSSYMLWPGPSNTSDIAPNAHMFYRELASKCMGRAFVHTSRGYYGLGPHITRPGDQCCVLQGSGVPFLLRPLSTNGSQEFRLVGEAFIHGVMKGEVLEKVKASELQEQIIAIR